MRALFLLALAISVVDPGAIAAADNPELSGRVVDADTGQPVVRAHITVRFLQGGQPAPEVVLVSDGDGTFKITNLPQGQFQVACEKAGYLPLNQMGGSANPGAPSADASTTITLKMTAQAAVEGAVTDDKDGPAENTFIQLVRQQIVNGRKQFQIAGSGGTDETGFFRIFGVTAGHYYVAIMPRLNGARRSRPLAYPQLYYPSALDMDTAQPIDLKAGDEMQLKIQLPEPIRAYEVTGVIATALSSVSVGLARLPLGPVFQNQGESRWDDKTKTFKILHVTPGMYQLTAFAQDGKNSLRAGATISVSNSDVGGIRLEPIDAGIDGTVRSDGSGPQIRMFVNFQSANQTIGAPVDSDGKFHVQNLQPGTFRIQAQTGPQSCIRSVLQGGRDVRDGIVIAPGVAPEPVEIVLTSHCGSVDVTLDSSDGAPNTGAFLLRKSGDDFVLETQFTRQRLNGDGNPHFIVQGVSPGDYVLFLWPADAPIEYTSPEYMHQYESYGTAVSVTEDNKTSVTVDKVLVPKN